jgi:hypothetical protein
MSGLKRAHQVQPYRRWEACLPGYFLSYLTEKWASISQKMGKVGVAGVWRAENDARQSGWNERHL